MNDRRHTLRGVGINSQIPMPNVQGNLFEETFGNWELGVGSWELGVGSYQASSFQPCLRQVAEIFR